MATKKTTRTKAKKTTRKAPSKKKKEGGLGTFIRSKRFAHIRGAIYILFALFLLIALVGLYATTGHGGWLGKAGYALADFVATRLFGIGSFGLSLLLFVYGLKLWNVEVMPWWKTLGSTMFWMLWLSLTLGYIDVAWVQRANFESYAGIGLRLAEPLHQWIGWWTLVLLAFVGVLFLVLVHKMELPQIKLPEKKEKHSKAELPRPTEEQEEQPAKREPVQPAEEQPAKAANSGFDEEAERLFHSKPEAEDAPKEMPADDGDPFDIDAEFERINARAQGQPTSPTPQPSPQSGTDEVSFTIEGLDPDAPAEPVQAEAEPTGDPATDETDELDPDDFRRHIGLDEPFDPHLELGDYRMPPTSLLDDSEAGNVRVTKEELVANKDRIVQTLHDYGIEITEISATIGPTVTLYKIKPAPGVRISKIKGLENDIALSLAALGIRIIAPIPGESNIGIEVPNAKPQIVAMKTMLESPAFTDSKMELPIAFGKTISNEPFVTDLAKMPHLLMAGATGTGKSVGLNAVLASLLYKKHPSELKLVLVDPKKVEFSLYSKIDRHYLAKMPDEEEAVITDVKKVVRTLNSLCIEMDSRYDLLKAAKVRKITEYNEKFCKRMLNPNNGHRYLPYIVVVIDEFGDLIMTAGKEVELPIARLAQLARAVGIHLIIATQRPTTNIITGTIKANFPARVAFRVTSGIDSKTILDTGGAQQLIGRGDMLISLAGKDMVRLQCALIDTPEIERLVDYIGEQRGYPSGFELPEYLDENEEPNKEFDAKSKDEFFNDAARLVVSSQFGSTSLLQRKLQLGYNRAGRIIDQLEAAGIVGPSNGSKPRDVLIHDEVSLEDLLRSL